MSTTTDPTPPARASERVDDSPALRTALDRQVRFDARTRQGLSNHLPMELIALDRLGAPPERLDAMLERWSASLLAERRDTAVFDAFRAEIAADGVDAAVATHLPRLVESPSSEWFHSMIRLAYSVESGHPDQVGSALADWVAYERVLPGQPPEGGDRPAIEVLRDLRDAPIDTGGSHADLATVAAQDAFRSLAAPVVVDDALADLAAAAAAAHVAGANIATLHLVTGTQAARWLLPRLGADDRRRLARRTVQAVTAGYVAGGRVELPTADGLDRLRAVPLPGWDEVRAAAVTTPDVHATKLVFTCRLERRATGDPLYDWLAAREVGLV